jgi:hypothetical protein
LAQDTVLILAPDGDPHAALVAEKLQSELGIAASIWDSAMIPSRDYMSVTVGRSDLSAVIRCPDRDIQLTSLRSIWWRRPGVHIVSSEVGPEIRSYCIRETDTLFRGTVDVLGVPIVNSPAADAAARKPAQLAAAHALGIAIPRTLMTNDPAEVKAFWEACGRNCIYKAFSSPAHRLIETRVLAAEDFPYLDSLRHAPIIVQERVDKDFDVRAIVVGREVFSASVRVDAHVDCRVDLLATWERHDLPEDVRRRLVDLVSRLNLCYGCIDLAKSKNGEYFFLEINPAGQFLFVEMDTGQPLCLAMARLLARGGRN